MMIAHCRLPAKSRVVGVTRAAFVAVRPQVTRHAPVRGFADKAEKPAPAGTPYDKIALGVPKEIFQGEKRVATTPKVVEKLSKMGMRCFVEKGAGEGANISDELYKKAGAEIQSAEEVFKKDMIFKVRRPQPRCLPRRIPALELVMIQGGGRRAAGRLLRGWARRVPTRFQG